MKRLLLSTFLVTACLAPSVAADAGSSPKPAPSDELVSFLQHGDQAPTDGTPVEVPLEKIHHKEPSLGSLQVQVWNIPHWKFTISIPNGGLQVRDEKQFTAPTTGYKKSDTVDLSHRKGALEIAERHYFIKLSDGKYGRLHVFVNAKGGVLFDGYANLSGSQNLADKPAGQPIKSL